MSKLTIKISYPDASEIAMRLTEAMIRRAPGKRVVETKSEDPDSHSDGELFAGFDACRTSTSVELTLTLTPSSMDYTLETLIRPNLTTEEKKQILGEDDNQAKLNLDDDEADLEKLRTLREKHQMTMKEILEVIDGMLNTPPEEKRNLREGDEE